MGSNIHIWRATRYILRWVNDTIFNRQPVKRLTNEHQNLTCKSANMSVFHLLAQRGFSTTAIVSKNVSTEETIDNT